MTKHIFIAFVLLPGIFTFAGIVGNGSFAAGAVGEIPAGWSFAAGRAEARMTVDDGFDFGNGCGGTIRCVKNYK